MAGNRRLRWLVCILVILTVVLSACNSSSKSSNPETPSNNSNTPAPETGSKDPAEGTTEAGANELVIAWLSDPPSMDPHMSTDQQTSVMTTHIYNTLVIHDKDLNIQPGWPRAGKQSMS